MRKWMILCMLLIFALCLAGCVNGNEPDEPEAWDTKPHLCVDGISYDTRGHAVDTLPEGYVYVGDLTAEDAGTLTDLVGCKMYRSEEESGIYLYQQWATVVGDTMDWNKLRWCYVRYVP